MLYQLNKIAMIKIVVLLEIAPDASVKNSYVTVAEKGQKIQRYSNARLLQDEYSVTIENRDTGNVELKLVNVPVMIFYHRDYMGTQ